MKINKHQIIIGSLLTLAVIITGTNSYHHFKNQPKPLKQLSPQTKSLNYASVIKPEDSVRLPEPINGHTIKIPILMYHHVGELPKDADATFRGLTVSPQNFEDQVNWLKNNDYTSISLNDIYLYSKGKFTMPKKPVVFTFDDGYNDAFIKAIPILKKYGYFGSFAIITNYVGATQGNNIYATWQTITQAELNGQEIVSHTQNHFDGSNPKFSATYILQNLNGSVADIKNNLGLTTNILIYPYGHYTAEYITQAKKAGFVMGLTVHEGQTIDLDNLMQLPRVRVRSTEDLQQFEDIILDRISTPKTQIQNSTSTQTSEKPNPAKIGTTP